MMPAPARRQDHDEIKRELQATLAARQELGATYDDQFIDRLVERLTAQVRQEMARMPRPHSPALPARERVPIAICSLIFGIPLVAISAGFAGPVGLIIAFLALVLINVAAGINW
jgi:hypothetical protein